MGRQGSRDSEERFSVYLDGLASVMGHAGRVGPMRDYCAGLLLPCERKSVEPIAAVTAPDRVSAQHQALLHFVAQGGWSDAAVLAQVRAAVLPAIERHGAIAAWIIDDTGFPKHGRHSVGVSHQYCGESGKQDNCQIAVSLSLANHHASLPVAYRLYLPKSWADDGKRRGKAGVPEGIAFKTKLEIARADRMGVRGRLAARCRADGCGLRHGRIAAGAHDGFGPAVCRRHPRQDAPLAGQEGDVGGVGGGARARPGAERVEDGHVAAGLRAAA
jgi:SRSO17 transposase